MSIYDFEVRAIDGQASKLDAYRGKLLLIVNVASQCGFTPQYKGLEALYRKYQDKGLVVLGFPCDQFGHQEPGDETEIKRFCSLNYDVCQDRGERCRHASAVPISQKGKARAARQRGDQVELHQVSGRARRRRVEALRAER